MLWFFHFNPLNATGRLEFLAEAFKFFTRETLRCCRDVLPVVPFTLSFWLASQSLEEQQCFSTGVLRQASVLPDTVWSCPEKWSNFTRFFDKWWGFIVIELRSFILEFILGQCAIVFPPFCLCGLKRLKTHCVSTLMYNVHSRHNHFKLEGQWWKHVNKACTFPNKPYGFRKSQKSLFKEKIKIKHHFFHSRAKLTKQELKTKNKNKKHSTRI